MCKNNSGHSFYFTSCTYTKNQHSCDSWSYHERPNSNYCCSKVLTKLKKMEQNIINELKNYIDTQLSAAVSEINQATNQTVKTNLNSPEYAVFLQRTLGDLDPSFAEVAKQYLNEEIELTTTGGVLTGIITEIGIDYLKFTETTGTDTLVPYNHISNIILKGNG